MFVNQTHTHTHSYLLFQESNAIDRTEEEGQVALMVLGMCAAVRSSLKIAHGTDGKWCVRGDGVDRASQVLFHSACYVHASHISIN
jgi:hypothetical protein